MGFIAVSNRVLPAGCSTRSLFESCPDSARAVFPSAVMIADSLAERTIQGSGKATLNPSDSSTNVAGVLVRGSVFPDFLFLIRKVIIATVQMATMSAKTRIGRPVQKCMVLQKSPAQVNHRDLIH